MVGKAGKKTYGLDQFFSGLQQKVIPSLSFFVVSLVSVNQRQAYPVCLEQTIHSPEEKAACKAKKEAKKAKAVGPKRKRGRPKGSKNKAKSEMLLTPELQQTLTLVLKIMMVKAGNYFTRDVLEDLLTDYGPIPSERTLDRVFAQLPQIPGIQVTKKDKFKYYGFFGDVSHSIASEP